jgi:hypothetical protein
MGHAEALSRIPPMLRAASMIMSTAQSASIGT